MVESGSGDGAGDHGVHDYEEAVHLAGTGRYQWGLVGCVCAALLAMAFDMFGFSVVVTGARCDLALDASRQALLLSMPFFGPIVMSYPWGYVSDTRGRRWSLLLALWGAFLVSALSAFSPNWVVLAVCKLISTSLCSCAQSSTFALLGESCSASVRSSCLVLAASVLHFAVGLYIVVGYLILNLHFSCDLGFVDFTPWRLLVLVLALPLGFAAVSLLFFYESPKFVLNTGNEQRAVELLASIWRRNHCKPGQYPVRNVVLSEKGNASTQEDSLLRSLWQQTAPLFRPPLLLRTIQLYFIVVVIYSCGNSLTMLLPSLSKVFFSHPSDRGDQTLCQLIESQNTTTIQTECLARVEGGLAATGAALAVVFPLVNVVVSRLAARRRLLAVAFFLVSSACAAAAVHVRQRAASLLLYFGVLLSSINVGFTYSYTVDFYPTSYRGMAACLAVLVARAGGLAGTALAGTQLPVHCAPTFYFLAAYIFCAAIVSYFLPH